MKWANGCVTAIHRRRQQSAAKTFGKEIKSLASGLPRELPAIYRNTLLRPNY